MTKRYHEGCSHNKCAHRKLIGVNPKRFKCTILEIPIRKYFHLCKHFTRSRKELI
jgi:hypothetical protein